MTKSVPVIFSVSELQNPHFNTDFFRSVFPAKPPHGELLFSASESPDFSENGR
jgi:hypothetical protein